VGRSFALKTALTGAGSGIGSILGPTEKEKTGGLKANSVQPTCLVQKDVAAAAAAASAASNMGVVYGVSADQQQRRSVRSAILTGDTSVTRRSRVIPSAALDADCPTTSSIVATTAAPVAPRQRRRSILSTRDQNTSPSMNVMITPSESTWDLRTVVDVHVNTFGRYRFQREDFIAEKLDRAWRRKYDNMDYYYQVTRAGNKALRHSRDDDIIAGQAPELMPLSSVTAVNYGSYLAERVELDIDTTSLADFATSASDLMALCHLVQMLEFELNQYRQRTLVHDEQMLVDFDAQWGIGGTLLTAGSPDASVPVSSGIAQRPRTFLCDKVGRAFETYKHNLQELASDPEQYAGVHLLGMFVSDLLDSHSTEAACFRTKHNATFIRVRARKRSSQYTAFALLSVLNVALVLLCVSYALNKPLHWHGLWLGAIMLKVCTPHFAVSITYPSAAHPACHMHL
jgi:hypothetical protein